MESVRRFQSFQTLQTFKPLLMAILLAGWTMAGCRQQMATQPYAEPLESSNFFSDGMASRPVPPGTVPHGGEEPDELLHTGKIGGKPADRLPFAVTREVLARGQERYNIYCAPCHDRVGTGQGMIVRRGFPRAQSFHEPRLREAPPSHFFEIMTLGFGAMPSYSAPLPPRDRWAVIAYIRALQLSRHAQVTELTPEDLEKLKQAK